MSAARPLPLDERRVLLDDFGDLLSIEDMAELLGTSTRTIHKRRRARTFPFPELVSIDRKPRWAKAVVRQVIESSSDSWGARRRRAS